LIGQQLLNIDRVGIGHRVVLLRLTSRSFEGSRDDRPVPRYDAPPAPMPHTPLAWTQLHRWDLANMLVNDEGRRLATGFRCDFSGYGLNMAGKKNPREWGSIRKQPICCEQATDRCGDDARRQD
jgi:hypothetical protein